MARILKGGEVASAISEKLKNEAAALKEAGVIPKLAVMRVGDRADDISYERGLTKRCAGIGIEVQSVVFPDFQTPQDEVLRKLSELANDDSVHGILIFRPLPAHISDEAVRAAMPPEKDVDGITDISLAGVFANTKVGFPPCTAQACIELLDHYGIDLKGKKATVIGRSLVIGKPVAMMLLAKHATVTICHTRTKDMPAVCREAEVIIASAGKAEIVDGSYFAPDQVIVDVGINVLPDGSLCGDVKFSEAGSIVGAITPVPGGVGSVTTAVLASHVIEAAKRKTIT